jgi:hypothetical protein
MDIEMMTRNPQSSDWSLEEDNITERQNSFNTTNNKSSIISNNLLININKDESRGYVKTK